MDLKRLFLVRYLDFFFFLSNWIKILLLKVYFFTFARLLMLICYPCYTFIYSSAKCRRYCRKFFKQSWHSIKIDFTYYFKIIFLYYEKQRIFLFYSAVFQCNNNTRCIINTFAFQKFIITNCRIEMQFSSQDLSKNRICREKCLDSYIMASYFKYPLKKCNKMP